MLHRYFIRFFMPAIAVSLFFIQVETAWAKGCLNGGCHQELTAVRYLHGPVAAEMAGVDGCGMCHLSAGAACTATSPGSFSLKGKLICQACHDKGTGSQHSQSQVESKCLNCHNPHGSETSSYMLRPGK